MGRKFISLTQPTAPRGAAPGAGVGVRRGVRRRGFTLLEILVVIGIIILLVAIGVIAFGALDQSGKVTKTTLANLTSMLAAYQAQTALRQQPGHMYVNGREVKPPSPPASDLWKTPADTAQGGGAGPVTVGSDPRYEWDAVANTQIVLQMLARMPDNKQILTRLPGKQVHGQADAADKGDKLLPSGASNKTIDPPLILDGWNNPIIFVGADGLRGVNYPGSGTTLVRKTVTSVGIIDSATPAPTELPEGRRPFFASAGPDGDFRTGEDNVYSFEQ